MFTVPVYWYPHGCEHHHDWPKIGEKWVNKWNRSNHDMVRLMTEKLCEPSPHCIPVYCCPHGWEDQLDAPKVNIDIGKLVELM